MTANHTPPPVPSATAASAAIEDDHFSYFCAFFEDDDFGPASVPDPQPFSAPSPSMDQNAMKRPRVDDDLVNGFVSLKRSASSSLPAHNSIEVADAGVQETNLAPQPHQRRLWVKERSQDWWDYYNNPDLPEEEFRTAFRMSRATFDFLCDELGSAVAKEDTALRAAIPVRQRIAVCVWRLATGEPLRLVSRRFGLGISTCHKLVLEVCTAIRDVLMPRSIHWPAPSDLAAAAARFQSLSGISNVAGAMYTTHIPIIAPKVGVATYFNRRHTERNQKTSYTVTLQGVVDPDGVFTDVCIGWPGSMTDDQVLEKSALWHRGNNGQLNHQWIVGGVGYPLMDWLLVPYAQSNLTWAQHEFNEKIGGVHRVAKQAFSRLKGRWGCLQKRTEVKLSDLPVFLAACCVLHNICEMRKEKMEPAPEFELVDDEMVSQNPFQSASAMQTRDTIAHTLLHHGGLARTGFL